MKANPEAPATRDFAGWSYQRHAEHCAAHAAQANTTSLCSNLYPQDTVDALRHRRMYTLLNPLLDTHVGAQWLTVGDGRHGNDAHYIRGRGGHVLATNLSDSVLSAAHDQGYIDDYRAENAESLSFQNNTFDFVFCKESFHHFPRPYLALYEMLRVARLGVVLIEPQDRYADTTALQQFIRPLLYIALRVGYGMRADRHLYEESGNYVYSLSVREMEKVALGLNLPSVAFKGLNDYFEKRFLTAKADRSDPLFRRFIRTIRFGDLLANLGLVKHRYGCLIFFRQSPSPALRTALERTAFRIRDLPRNPYCETPQSSVAP